MAVLPGPVRPGGRADCAGHVALVGFNLQAEQAAAFPDDLPVLAICHDDRPNPLAAFAGLNVWLYRAMSPYSLLYKQLPHGARFTAWNEADMPYDPDGWAAYLRRVKADRPDIQLVYGACNTANWPNGGQWPPDLTLIGLCDFYATHIPTFATPEQIGAGIQWPFAVTEVELDPNDPDINALPAGDPQRGVLFRQKLMAGAQAAVQAGAVAVFLWGQSMTEADAANDVELQAQVRAFNQQQAQGGNVASTTEEQIEQQMAIVVDAFKAIAQGKMNGADGLAGKIVALQGGAPLDFTPLPDAAPKA